MLLALKPPLGEEVTQTGLKRVVELRPKRGGWFQNPKFLKENNYKGITYSISREKRHLLFLKQEQFFVNHTVPMLAITWQMLYLPSTTTNVSD